MVVPNRSLYRRFSSIKKGRELVNDGPKQKCYAVTGTFHGSIVFAYSEGEARRMFHQHYNGESILYVYFSFSMYVLNEV